MKKSYYSSGFLYHPDSEQILLSRNSSSPNLIWTLFGSPSQGNETSVENFRRLLHHLLKLNFSLSSIHQVYDYYHVPTGKKHFISYAEVKELTTFPFSKNVTFAWFSAAEISKLSLSGQTKQDIVVGRRVIDSEARRNAGERTIG